MDVVWHLLAGGISAVVAKTATAPLERLRILQQTKSNLGVLELSTNIRDAEGISAFWRGNLPALLRIFPTYALRLTLFDQFKFFSKQETFRSAILSGCASAFVTIAATYPLDVIRTQMAASYKQSPTLMQTVRDVYTRGAFYKGFGINMIETVPYVGISLGSYDFLKQMYPLAPPFILALSTGIAATTICYPLDTLRRYVVVNPELSVNAAFKTLVAEGGWRRFYRGLPVALAKAGPTVGIILSLNDFLKSKFLAR
jgi:hypothetical protein